MLIYKTSGKDLLEKLKEKGYSTFKLRKDNLLSQSSISKLNQDAVVGINVLLQICELLDCQPGDILLAVDPVTGRINGSKKAISPERLQKELKRIEEEKKRKGKA